MRPVNPPGWGGRPKVIPKLSSYSQSAHLQNLDNTAAAHGYGVVCGLAARYVRSPPPAAAYSLAPLPGGGSLANVSAIAIALAASVVPAARPRLAPQRSALPALTLHPALAR